jgi:2-dehydropantoate 2-reductase
VIQDGIGKIVFAPCERLERFFKENKIDYEVSENMIYSQWVKLGVNIILNELSAIYNLTVGELRNRTDFSTISERLINEILEVAKSEKIGNLEKYRDDVLSSINLIADDGRTSMLQDILAKRKTEIDIFSGEIINRATKHNILTPENIKLYNKIKEIEKDY